MRWFGLATIIFVLIVVNAIDNMQEPTVKETVR